MCGKGRECICISGNHRSMVATDAAGNLHLSHLALARQVIQVIHAHHIRKEGGGREGETFMRMGSSCCVIFLLFRLLSFKDNCLKVKSCTHVIL